MLLLQRSEEGGAVASRVASPELVFSEGASVELTYWLGNTETRSEVDFLLYR